MKIFQLGLFCATFVLLDTSSCYLDYDNIPTPEILAWTVDCLVGVQKIYRSNDARPIRIKASDRFGGIMAAAYIRGPKRALGMLPDSSNSQFFSYLMLLSLTKE